MSETIEPDAAAPTASFAPQSVRFPGKGERVERLQTGIRLCGTVFYSDHQLQLLVKWDDGTSSSLRLDTPLPWPLRTIDVGVDADADAA
jgi:hypothetical protein